MKPYQIIAANNKAEATVLMYGYIGRWSEVQAKQFAVELLRLQAEYKKITIRLNSGGGEVFEGYAIFNSIKSSTVPVHIMVDGVAASMGSIIAVAGHKTYMAKNATMMIHKPSSYVSGQSHKLRNDADLLDKLEGLMIATLVERTGKPEAEVKEWLKNDTDKWFTAQEALDNKLIDGIYEPLAKTAQLPQSKSAEEFEQAYAPELSRFAASLNPTNQNQNMSKFSNLLVAMAITGVDTTNEDACITAIEAKFNTLKGDVVRLTNENTALRTAAEDAQKSKVKALVDGAITAKKITEAERAQYEADATANYDLVARVLNNMKAPVDFTKPFTPGTGAVAADRKDWSYSKWSQEDPKGLAKMKAENADAFWALFENEFGKLPDSEKK